MTQAVSCRYDNTLSVTFHFNFDQQSSSVVRTQRSYLIISKDIGLKVTHTFSTSAKVLMRLIFNLIKYHKTFSGNKLTKVTKLNVNCTFVYCICVFISCTL